VRGGQSLLRLLPRGDVEQIALGEKLSPIGVLDDETLVLDPDRASIPPISLYSATKGSAVSLQCATSARIRSRSSGWSNFGKNSGSFSQSSTE
jgi:hypothetical protein